MLASTPHNTLSTDLNIDTSKIELFSRLPTQLIAVAETMYPPSSKRPYHDFRHATMVAYEANKLICDRGIPMSEEELEDLAAAILLHDALDGSENASATFARFALANQFG